MPVTASGSMLPMADLIRMASHSWHCLCVFNKHSERAIYLGRSKRIASADQRIVLHAKGSRVYRAGLHHAGLPVGNPSCRRLGRRVA